MSLFRVIAFVLFVIAAVLVAVNQALSEPLFWIASGLAALAIAGASFDRNLG